MNQAAFDWPDDVMDGLERAHFEWIASALTQVKRLSLTRDEFTTDDVWEGGIDMPKEPRAMGAVMCKAMKRGWITPTDRTRKSTRPECHKRPVRVWRSA